MDCKSPERSHASYKAFPVYSNKFTCCFYRPTGNKFQSSPYKVTAKKPFPNSLQRVGSVLTRVFVQK